MTQITNLEGKIITIQQRDSATHTKFFLTKSGKPMPEKNFARARAWMQEGLLHEDAAAFVQAVVEHVEHGKPLMFRTGGMWI